MLAGSKPGSCLPNVHSDGQAGHAEPGVAPDRSGIPFFSVRCLTVTPVLNTVVVSLSSSTIHW